MGVNTTDNDNQLNLEMTHSKSGPAELRDDSLLYMITKYGQNPPTALDTIIQYARECLSLHNPSMDQKSKDQKGIYLQVEVIFFGDFSQKHYK